MGRACPVRDCDVEVDADKLMCLPHWRRVPRALQMRVYRTWRAFLRYRNRETADKWRAAASDACDAVRARETTVAR